MPWTKRAKTRIVGLVESAVFSPPFERTPRNRGWYIPRPKVEAFIDTLAADIVGASGIVFIEEDKIRSSHEIAFLLCTECRRERFASAQDRAAALVARCSFENAYKAAAAVVGESWKFAAKGITRPSPKGYATVGYYLNDENIDKFQNSITGRLGALGHDIVFELRDDIIAEITRIFLRKPANDQMLASAVVGMLDARWRIESDTS